MLKKLFFLIAVLALSVLGIMAQEPPPPAGPPMPGLMIPLPEGVLPPPPEAGPEAFETFLADVFGIIAGDDGLMTLDELKAWMKEHGKPPEKGVLPPPEPPPTEPPPVDLSLLPDPPACDDTLFTHELLPQAVNHPCGASLGNLIFRTVCNAAGYNSQAISMPAGRTAGCFGIEAITKNVVIFKIYPEADPTNILFDSTRDGLENLGAVMGTLTHTTDTVYRIELDMAASDPDARVTVRFVDY